MNPSNARWMRGDYFLLDSIGYDPNTGQLRVRFRNGDLVSVLSTDLWQDRPGRPDWPMVQIDPDTRGAILVPTVAGHPTLEGDRAEIPGDVIRTATDAEYRAYVLGLCVGEGAGQAAAGGGSLTAPPV